MATQYANGKIVTSGLVLALDAADRNSYPGSGTTWNDVSGNGYNGTLVNGPTFSNNSIVFDGTNDYLNIPNIPLTNYTTITIEMFISSSFPNESMLWSIDGGGGPDWYTKDNTMGYNSYGGDVYGFSASVMRGGWRNIAMTYTKNQSVSLNVVYVNGNQVTTSQQLGGTSARSFSTGLKICSDINGGLYFLQAIIPVIKVYNRALSPQEILQNYNAQKSRFNL
jgi:hypothetical protein